MSYSPDTSLSRRERERQMRRRAMLDAARTVFAEKGYADATLDEIAERAEFGKGTLYNYFEGGKEELLFAVFDDIYQEIETLIRTVFQDELDGDASLRDAFHTFAVRHFEIIRDQQDLFLVLVKEAYRLGLSDDENRVEFFQKQHDRLVDALRPALEKAVERGEVQSFPVSSIADMLLSNVRGMGVHCTMEKRICPDEDSILDRPEDAADFLTTFLFDGLQSNGHPDSSA